MLNRPKPVVLLIIDRFGYSLDKEYNTIAMANTPCWNKLQENCPMTLLSCSSAVAGLPSGQMGNSEVGHVYAMDRDNRWDRVKQAYNLIAKDEADSSADFSLQGLEAAYQRGETGDFVLPTAILDSEHHAVILGPEDSIVFMNFRADHAREISLALTATTFDSFDGGRAPHAGYYCTLTEYQQNFNYTVAFPPTDLKNCLDEYSSSLGMTQLRLAETEKFAHVTFFLNGGINAAFPGKARILAPSTKVRTYDLQPEMNTPEVTDNLVAAIICNYANCDMMGHTGIIDAVILAVEAVDALLQRIVGTLNSVCGRIRITADHGNIEQMVNKEAGQPHTAHTTSSVPLIYVGGDLPLNAGGSLSDLASAVLAILGVPQPAEMTGRSLITFA